MRVLPPALRTAISQGKLVCADLFQIDATGTTYYFTNCDRDLVLPEFAEPVYISMDISRGRIRASDGLEIDDFEIEIAHGGGGDLAGYTWVAAALADVLDEAPVRVYRAVLEPSDWSVIGAYLRFSGVVTDVEPGSSIMRLVVSASGNGFSRAFPNATYEKTCVWAFGGPGCDFPSTIDFTVTAGAESTVKVLHIATLPGGLTGAHLFLAGFVTVGSESRTIIDAAAAGAGTGVGTMVSTGYGFLLSPSFAVAIPDTATVGLSRGCIKTAAVCAPTGVGGWLDNLDHFMGAPVAPAKL